MLKTAENPFVTLTDQNAYEELEEGKISEGVFSRPCK